MEYDLPYADGEPTVYLQWSMGVTYSSGACGWNIDDVEILAVELGAPPLPLEIDISAISAAAGGIVNYALDAGQANAFRDYFLLGGISGTDPGIPIPGTSVTLPLNWDIVTDLIYTMANSPAFKDFHGVLDASGKAAAFFDTLGPLPPTAVGVHIYSAYLLYNPIDFASNSVEIVIVP